jgi:hypothetical protein
MIEIVVSRGGVHVVLDLTLAGNDGLFARVDTKSGAAGSHLAIALPGGDASLIGVRVRIDAIFAGSIDRERHIWSVDLEVLVALQSADANV